MLPSTHARYLASAGALAALAAAAAPSSAQAAGSPFTCEASALSLSVAGQAPIEPAVTGVGSPSCDTKSVGIGNLLQPLPAVFGVSAINAATAATGVDDKKQVLAAGGIADAKVGALSSLGVDLSGLLNQVPLPAQAQAINVPLAPISSTPLGTTLALAGVKLPDNLTVDLSGAARELLKLPSTDLLSAKAAVAYAAGSCASGSPVLTSARNLAGVKVLGNDIDLDKIGDQPILDTQSIDLSQIKLSDVTVNLPQVNGLTNSLLTQLKPQIDALVANALAALPKVPVPIDLARVTVAAGSETKTATSIERTGPRLTVSVLGQSLLDLKLGRAKVGSAGVDCAAPAAPTTAADTALQCTKRKLVLVDVVQQGSKVLLTGAADKKFVGKFVTIKFRADGSTAGRALVKPDGSFATTAAMPSKKLATTNLARYQAAIGTEKSLDLKLARRLTVEKLQSASGKVTIAGRVVQPLSSGAKTIELRRRVACGKYAVVKRFQPAKDGRYSVTVDAPAGQTATVYRLATRVRKTTSNPKTFPTFTLPRGVDLKN